MSTHEQFFEDYALGATRRTTGRTIDPERLSGHE